MELVISGAVTAGGGVGGGGSGVAEGRGVAVADSRVGLVGRVGVMALAAAVLRMVAVCVGAAVTLLAQPVSIRPARSHALPAGSTFCFIRWAMIALNRGNVQPEMALE